MNVKKVETVWGPRYYVAGTTRWAHAPENLRKKGYARIAKPIQIPLDTSGFALPKPGPREKSQPKDGRLIESQYKYAKTKKAMWEKQRGICECGAFMPTPAYGHRHHVNGRGGGKRDDTHTVLICPKCHLAEHGVKI